jgi:hypothetical protein
MTERAFTLNSLGEWAVKLGSILGVTSFIAGIAGFFEFRYMFERMGASWLINTVPTEYFVRKGAMVFLYVIIGLVVSWGLSRTPIERNFLRRWLAVFVGLIVLVSAMFALYLLLDPFPKYSPSVYYLGQISGFLLGVSVGCYIYDLVFNEGFKSIDLMQVLQMFLCISLAVYTAPNIVGRAKGYELSSGTLKDLPVVYVKGDPKYQLIEAMGDNLVVFESASFSPRKISIIKFGKDVSIGLQK